MDSPRRTPDDPGEGLDVPSETVGKSIAQLYVGIYSKFKYEYERKTGEKLEEYQPLSRESLNNFFASILDVEMPIAVIAETLLDVLIRLQALPNANHRTAVYFVHTLLRGNGLPLIEHEVETPDWWAAFNRLVGYSRGCLRFYGETRAEDSANYDKECHRKVMKKWMGEMVGAQSERFRRVSTVRSLFICMMSQRGNPNSSASS
jgi:hypothetical protein